MFGDFKSVKEIEHDMCAGYDLEFYDRASLKEIERLITLGSYTDEHTIQEHLEFLERLLYKLQYIKMEEIKEGFPTLELDEAISEINTLFKKLTNMLYVFKNR
ncbi:hypothetical protein JXB27_02105 [Candidatus Woesearchaeota archaeon]|nr:hypothetical protein [Candidatus Woesearchaeota archaeon]